VAHAIMWDEFVFPLVWSYALECSEVKVKVNQNKTTPVKYRYLKQAVKLLRCRPKHSHSLWAPCWHSVTSLDLTILKHIFPWSTKLVIRVNFFMLRCINPLKAEPVSFPLIYGLIGLDNIWLRYNYLRILNRGCKKNLII